MRVITRSQFKYPKLDRDHVAFLVEGGGAAARRQIGVHVQECGDAALNTGRIQGIEALMEHGPINDLLQHPFTTRLRVDEREAKVV